MQLQNTSQTSEGEADNGNPQLKLLLFAPTASAVVAQKACIKCKVVKSLPEFYPHKEMGDGHLNKCKQCTKEEVAKHRQQNLEYIQWYDRERGRTPERQAKNKAYNDAHPEQIKETGKRWTANNREKELAHAAVQDAVTSGTLKRQSCCVCKSNDSEAHHEDYSKRLDVIWYCPKHHAARHRGIRDMNRKTFDGKKGYTARVPWREK